MQDKNIAISELKKLIENCKGKSVETQFNKPSVVRQPNAQRIPKPSVLGKLTPFSNSPEMRSFQTKQSVNKTNVSFRPRSTTIYWRSAGNYLFIGPVLIVPKTFDRCIDHASVYMAMANLNNAVQPSSRKQDSNKIELTLEQSQQGVSNDVLTNLHECSRFKGQRLHAISDIKAMKIMQRYEHVDQRTQDRHDGIIVKDNEKAQSLDRQAMKEQKTIKLKDKLIRDYYICYKVLTGSYTAVDSCESAQEIWLTSIDGESIESYYHRFSKLMNDFKRNKYFPEKIASNLKFLNNLQPEWSRHIKRRDAAYLQTQLQIAQKEEAGLQLQAEEFNLMAAVADLDEIEEVNANCILMANLQQASISGTQTNTAPVYDSDGSAKVKLHENCYNNELFNMFTQEEQYIKLLEPIPKPHQVPQNDSNVISEVYSVEQDGGTVEQHSANVEETRAYHESLFHNLAAKVEKVNSVNRKMKEKMQN
ncbi:hypothetical protein Tco_0006117 [Tanacetum coccineum]